MGHRGVSVICLMYYARVIHFEMLRGDGSRKDVAGKWSVIINSVRFRDVPLCENFIRFTT